MSHWYRALEPLNLPERPRILLAAPHGDTHVVAPLLELRPLAEVIPLRIARQQEDRACPVPAGENSIDAALFDHAVDDMVIEALCHHEGMDLPEAAGGEYSPWVRALRVYWRAGDLEEVTAPVFVAVLQSCQRALRSPGKIVFHHRVFGADLGAGQPMDLYTEYIALARKWVRDSSLRLREVALDRLDPQWWLCLERRD